MTVKTRISHSAWSKYLLCPRMYDLHYNKKLRPTGTSSSLLFGLAIDEGLNAILLKDKDPVKVFRDKFTEFDDKVSLHSGDIDFTILEEEQVKSLRNKDEFFKAWACLRVKGRILLEAYQQHFLPQVEEVISVQRNLDDRPGVIDAILRLRGHGVVLVDHKTASRPYTKGTLEKSTQLALYASNQKIDKAGFVVLLKSIPKVKSCLMCGADGTGSRHKTCSAERKGKRCGGQWDYGVDKKKAIQVIIGPVPDNNAALFEESVSQVEKAIDNKIFPANLTQCDWVYGSPCPYVKFCWQGNKQGLETKENT